jgi:Arc/MetJ family transcription regulator
MRTTIEIDETLLSRAMQIHGFRTKREAVDYALRRLVPERLSVDDARAMRGAGWDAELADVRGASQGPSARSGAA